MVINSCYWAGAPGVGTTLDNAHNVWSSSAKIYCDVVCYYVYYVPRLFMYACRL